MLNLISDRWIPVRRKDGTRTLIAPWQMADDSLAFPDWPRPDLNIACLELLIGLVFLADPPADTMDWESRQSSDPDRLRARLAPFAPAFELMGDGPRFMQDREAFESGLKDPNPPDMLFIDSAGGQTVRNNADLMVKRGRYPVLEPALAAMALFTLQAHAPSGGKGNRTSMRGGGPMVTLVDSGDGLWPLVWANVPDGAPAEAMALPWMRPTRTSEKGEQVFQHDVQSVEALFGMPRRLRLVARQGGITGVVQKPYGTNYAVWEHPLTPYYRQRPGSELLPAHPRTGPFGYRNWMGVVLPKRSEGDTARRARVVELWAERGEGRRAEVLVAGWAMDNMKPRDFTFSRAPLIDLPDDLADRIEGFVEAAAAVAAALRSALRPVLAEGEVREAAREAFFLTTQSNFERRLAQLTAVNCATEARGWLDDLREAAFAVFDGHALPGLADRELSRQQQIVQSRQGLALCLAGYGKLGQGLWRYLGLDPPEQKRRKAS